MVVREEFLAEGASLNRYSCRTHRKKAGHQSPRGGTADPGEMYLAALRPRSREIRGQLAVRQRSPDVCVASPPRRTHFPPRGCLDRCTAPNENTGTIEAVTVRVATFGALVLLWCVTPLAVQPALDLQAIQEAITIGQSRLESQRARFHAQYRVTVAQAPVDYIDIVTPFRRVVMAAEERARTGERGLTQRQALETLLGRETRVDLRVELTFHPLHTFVGVPAYELELTGVDGRRIEPEVMTPIPRHGLRVEGGPLPPGLSAPLVGGTLVAEFEGRLVADGTYIATLSEGTTLLARATIAFSLIR
jgi:hypothetical protein